MLFLFFIDGDVCSQLDRMGGGLGAGRNFFVPKFLPAPSYYLRLLQLLNQSGQHLSLFGQIAHSLCRFVHGARCFAGNAIDL